MFRLRTGSGAGSNAAQAVALSGRYAPPRTRYDVGVRSKRVSQGFCGRIVAATLLLLLAPGCAGPGARLAPAMPVAYRQVPSGERDAVYDFDGDGRVDYAERFDADGTPVRLLFDWTGDGLYDLDVPSPRRVDGAVPHVVIILDSVPFEMVRAFQDGGRFSQFYPPSRVIAPFPVMTDLSLAEFFAVAPCDAMESQYYDARHLNTGYFTYVRASNAPWLPHVDYVLDYVAHGLVYQHPKPWFGREMRKVQNHAMERSAGETFVAYAVGTSALGSRLGRPGHEHALDVVDRTCRWLIHTFAGRIQITLMSDHGHAIAGSEWIDLPGLLSDSGFRIADRLERPGDVVVPGFGMVTCAALYTNEPAAVSDAALSDDRIDLAAYVAPDGAVVVRSRDGEARIEAQSIATGRDADSGIAGSIGEPRLRYVPVDGDPLRMTGIMDGRLEADEEGYADADAWFAATADHEYPDAVYRLWRAFHGLMTYTPDVLLSIDDGAHCGSRLMTTMIGLKAAHGNLATASSTGFVMSTAGATPPVVRMEDLAVNLARIGVFVGGGASISLPAGATYMEAEGVAGR